MNPEEIKVGDKINIEALVIRKIHSEEQFITCELPTGLQFHIWQRDFEALSPANGTKNAEPAPKYDPCRLFKAGDIVEPCQVKGRWLSEAWKDRAGIRFIVTMSEDVYGYMLVKGSDSHNSQRVDAVYFQLVTPVEEQEPYNVFFEGRFVHVRKGEQVIVSFNLNAHPHAKEAAEAERDRLNEEWRKELE